MDYSMIPGYVRKETSNTGYDKLRIAPHHTTATGDAVKSAIDKFKEQRALAIQKKKEDDEKKKKEEEEKKKK
jgi:hypothetical protein